MGAVCGVWGMGDRYVCANSLLCRLIDEITKSPDSAFRFLCTNNELELAERVVEEGFSKEVLQLLRKVQVRSATFTACSRYQQVRFVVRNLV